MGQVADNIYVVFLGMGTVFVGLICIVLLCMLMSALVRKFESAETESPAEQSTPVPQSTNAPIADRQAIIAASCAVIAEELGEDVKNIKVVSFKRM